MEKSSEFVSQITNFPLLSPEENENGVSVLFSKIFKFGRNSPVENIVVNPPASEESSKNSPWNADPKREESESADVGSASQCSDDYSEGRSLQNVLKRISSLVALKTSSGTRYADTEQARYWMPDNVSKECYDCGARFSAFRRRHHCRVCGQIFCARCCSHRVPGQVCGCADGLRVCTYCCRIVLGYLQLDGGTTLSPDLKALQNNLKERIPKDNTQTSEQGFLLSRETPKEGSISGELGLSNHISLHVFHDTFRKMCFSLPLQQHRYKLMRYPGVWRGSDIIQWLIDHASIPTRLQAGDMCQSLMREGLLECVTEHQTFIDYGLYRPINLPATLAPEYDKNSMMGSTSSYCLNLNLAENSAHLVRGQRAGADDDVHSDCDSHVPLQSEGTDENKVFCESVDAAGSEHLRLLLVQGLARASLNLSWAPILLPLCQQVANMITPDTTGSEWDIRGCVRVKCVAGGAMRESCAVGGIVFTKNVAHRGMRTSLQNPRLLLLRCSIVYQRVEGKLMSLEPVIMQERDYLHNCCARILALAPDVVVIQGSVSRLAQDELRSRGIVLVIGVRAPTLSRLSRCTNAEILTSIDARVGSPRLGTCKAFYLLNYECKTLMVFEGFDKDLKGCSMILRGGSLDELSRVKKVISLILLAAYNWRLESSLLRDMSATLPISSSSLMFIDNSKDNSPEKEKTEDDDNHNDDVVDKDFSVKSDVSKELFNDIESNSVSKDSKFDQKSKESKLSIAFTDPLTSDIFSKSSGSHKRIEGDKGPSMSCGITINDFSDPLRSRQMSVDDDVFLPQKSVSKTNVIADAQTDTLRNRWSADEAVLSMSPHVRICAPYLESEIGRRSFLRHYYCTPLFPTPAITAPSTPRPINRTRKQSVKTGNCDLHLKDPHPFVSKALINGAEEPDVRRSLAHYRAIGGRLRHEDFSKKLSFINSMEGKNDSTQDNTKVKRPADPLDPEQHQRIHLLFYSFSSRSPNSPEFCVNPIIFRMDMYGNNDLSLGQFLERHCFTQQYTCTSPTCQVPLMQHSRKFVHGDGCITVSCVTVDSSATIGNPNRLLLDEDGKQSIMWWCRCMVCGEKGVGVGSSCLRPPSLALSFAKYLELRFNAPRYIRKRSCHHSLNQHYSHYFACGNITACFRYNKISSWDICLPPSNIATHYNTRNMRDFLINQVNDLVLKGHEVYGNIGEGEQEKEYLQFKQHIEQIQLNLTSSCLQEQLNIAGVIKWLWNISDAFVIAEKIIQESMEKWTTQTKAAFKIPQESVVDGKIESDDSSQTDVNVLDCATENKNYLTNSSDVENTVDEEEDKTDRRGLRTMLTQLLSNSQPAHQNGVVLCGGVVPIIVMAGEISSLVAAALASLQYHQQLHSSSQAKGVCTDSDEKEIGSSKERLENEGKSKNSKNTDHIDIQLQAGLFCCIYYPKQFLKLRALLLCPLESNPNIVNDFDIKLSTENESELKSDHNDPHPTVHKETEGELFKHALDEQDTASVEASPTMGVKRSSDDKNKKIRDHQGKMQNGIELSEIEEAFIRSLSRCIPWVARGGKSGSTFCKTKDDRFILKEMSKLELQLFVDLAPFYFNYMQSCHQNNLPTLLARIVGVYRVSGVEGIGGGVLVMENLWHGRTELSNRFDLKGAQRNRLAEQGAPDVVLLDENLLNLRLEKPLYLQSHSAGVLWAAVERDTTFLSSHKIMDYSLLLGLDEEKQELVVGIIDYIRTFTWDKKLEHIVKKGLGAGLPTIVSPADYKTRFCNAMRKYFLQSPNQWEELDRGLICDMIADS